MGRLQRRLQFAKVVVSLKYGVLGLTFAKRLQRLGTIYNIVCKIANIYINMFALQTLLCGMVYKGYVY